MAGSQVVLHERNDGKENRKNETRNLGLQSIVDREDTIVSQLVNDASKQRDVSADLVNTISKMNSIIHNLTYIANQIYIVVQDAYMADTTKTSKMVDIMQGAYNI